MLKPEHIWKFRILLQSHSYGWQSSTVHPRRIQRYVSGSAGTDATSRRKRVSAYVLGFTLVELLVVISIIGLLSSIVLTTVNSARMKARDARRLADLRQIQTALQLYYDASGSYPPVTYGPRGSLAGWEVSYKDPSQFLNQLLPYMPSVSVDPINRGNEPINMFFSPRPQDGNFFYMYYNYPNGAYYGCPWSGPFSVVGFRAAEKTDPSTLPKARCGPQPCAGGGIPNVCRDWSTEFDYSIFLVP